VRSGWELGVAISGTDVAAWDGYRATGLRGLNRCDCVFPRPPEILFPELITLGSSKPNRKHYGVSR